MTNDELRAAVIDELGNIAPETDAATIDPSDDLREALDRRRRDGQGIAACVIEDGCRGIGVGDSIAATKRSLAQSGVNCIRASTCGRRASRC